MRVLISTDTSCLINYETLKKYDISVFPLNVIVDGQEFLDGVTINQAQLEESMRAKKDIKTSTPPLGEIIEYFNGLFEKGYDHIIHFTISSKLSSMYDLFNNVAKQNFNGKLTVIDSYSICSIMFSHVMYAYEEASKGTPVEHIVEGLKKRRIETDFVFIPENLTALKNGGRISPTIALIGNSIGIKPVIIFKDGGLEKDELIRNPKRALVDRLQKAIAKFPISEYDYSVIEFGANESLRNYFYENARTMLGGEVIEGLVPINVCAHCGPGSIGFVVSPKVNGKSLKEFI